MTQFTKSGEYTKEKLSKNPIQVPLRRNPLSQMNTRQTTDQILPPVTSTTQYAVDHTERIIQTRLPQIHQLRRIRSRPHWTDFPPDTATAYSPTQMNSL